MNYDDIPESKLLSIFVFVLIFSFAFLSGQCIGRCYQLCGFIHPNNEPMIYNTTTIPGTESREFDALLPLLGHLTPFTSFCISAADTLRSAWASRILADFASPILTSKLYSSNLL